MSDYGNLLPPSKTALGVFKKLIEDKPDADMRAIPNEWLLKERGLSQKLSDTIAQQQALIEELAAALRDVKRGIDAEHGPGTFDINFSSARTALARVEQEAVGG